MNLISIKKNIIEQKLKYIKLSLDNNKRSDFDIHIFPEHFNRYEKVCKKCGFFKRLKPIKDSNRFYYFNIQNLNDDQFLDLYRNISFKNSSFFRYDLKKKIKENFYRLKINSEEYKFYYLIIILGRYLFENKIFLKDNLIKIDRNFQNFNPKSKNLIDKKRRILEKLNIVKKSRQSHELKKYLSFWFKKRYDLTILTYFFKKFIFSKNIFILVLGVDGSGKTTLCKKIKKICGYNSSYSYYGIGKNYWSNKIIKKTFQYFRSRNFNTAANLILILEFSIRRYFIISKKWQIFFIDRILAYSYLNQSFTNYILKLTYPKFDLVVYLHGDNKKIALRKKDTNLKLSIMNEKKIRKVLNYFKKKIIKIDITKNNQKQTINCLGRKILKNSHFFKKFIEV